MPDWRITTDHYDGAPHPDDAGHERADHRHPDPDIWADRYDKQLELRPAWANGRATR